jgi:hypothetical protein
MIDDILKETDNSFDHSARISSDEVTADVDVLRIRTSVNSFLPYEKSSEFDRLVEHLTGLEVTNEDAAEEVHVVQYVYGRVYFPHPDAMTVDQVSSKESKYTLNNVYIVSLY